MLVRLVCVCLSLACWVICVFLCQLRQLLKLTICSPRQPSNYVVSMVTTAGTDITFTDGQSRCRRSEVVPWCCCLLLSAQSTVFVSVFFQTLYRQFQLEVKWQTAWRIPSPGMHACTDADGQTGKKQWASCHSPVSHRNGGSSIKI